MTEDDRTQQTESPSGGAEGSKDNRTKAISITQQILSKIRQAAGPILRFDARRRRLLAVIILVTVTAVVLAWMSDKVVLYYLSRSYVDKVSDVLGLNKDLANAILLLTFIFVVAFARLAWSFSRRRRLIGIAGIAALLVGNSLVLWYGTKGSYFDRSGNAIKCYVLSRDGKVTYGERPGIDPQTGRQCRSVTAEMLERLKLYESGKRPERIVESNPVFFDPRSGEPIVWYSKTKDNKIEIFDLMGFHPDTGEELLPVTRDIANEWKREAAEEARRIPKLIAQPASYLYFDPRTGQPRAWYWLAEDGHYEFYDAPGFQPQTGDKLQVVTRDVLAQWKAKQTNPMTPKKVPDRVQITNDTIFFDPVTGSPRLWYWRREKGVYEFFDGPGFDPQNGQSLQSFTREKLTQYQSEIDEKTKELKREQERIQAQQAVERAVEDQRRIQQQKAEEAEAQKRLDETRRRTEAAKQCDDLAANPDDGQRAGQGVPYGELRPLAAQAVDACESAAKQNPDELRFQYQLARALELAGEGPMHLKNRQRAMVIEQELVAKGYAAAFDNLASIYRDRGDLETAVALFRKGAELGDSDSMVSLADLLNDQKIGPQGPDETALALYKRAAELGNQNGIRGYQDLMAKGQDAQQRQFQQLENQRMMLQFMGTVLRNVR
jgi:hypothetical protein